MVACMTGQLDALKGKSYGYNFRSDIKTRLQRFFSKQDKLYSIELINFLLHVLLDFTIVFYNINDKDG